MKIGAVLPLSVSGSYGVDDLNRVEILLKSLNAFMQSDFFDPFLVITPEKECKMVSDRLDKWQHLNVQVISEDVLVPQLKDYSKLRGWRKQQIIKIAAAEHINRDFYITFDADVICLKPLAWTDLIVEGKGILQYDARSRHPKWWKASARILNMDANVGDATQGMHITPAVLSADLTKLLISELTAFGSGHWVDNLCSLHSPRDPKNWTIGRFLKLKWTEYSLYYLCAHKHRLLDQYHIKAGTEQVPQLLLIHDSHPFENWNVASSFSPSNPGLFTVVGSKKKISPEKVWQRIRPYIPKHDLAHIIY